VDQKNNSRLFHDRTGVKGQVS